MEEYDPATDTWERKTDLSIARYDLSTSVVNGKIYAIGGAIDKQQHAITEVLSIVEEYNTGFGGQSVEASGKLATTWGKLKAAY